ncbi:MAG: hypothetical protein C0501_07915 [Isosphaera sp.]|nr:hypothetical protein [Isosphaera sp.]
MKRLRARLGGTFDRWDSRAWPDLLRAGPKDPNALEADCRDFVGCPSAEVEEFQRQAELAWAAFGGADASVVMGACCGDGHGRAPEFRGADPARLLRNARRFFAAGMAAGHLRHPRTGADLDALGAWVARFAGIPVGSVRGDLGRLGDGAIDLDRLLRLLPRAECLPLRLHLDHFLGVNRPDPAVTVRFPTYDGGTKQGAVRALDLWHVPDSPALIEHPGGSAVPLAPNLLAVIGRAHARCRFDGVVVWSLRTEYEDPELTPPQSGRVRTVGGESHTLAACVGFRALAEERRVDVGCLMSAQFDPGAWADANPALRPVGAEPQKAEAACRFGHLDRFLIAADSKFEDGRPESHSAGGRSIALVRPRTLDEAYDDATGLTAGLEAYLVHAAGLLDAVTPRYFGRRRKLSDLYIEPEVFKDEVELKRDETRPGREDDADRPAGKPPFEVADATAELIRYYREQLKNTRHRWADEWPRVRHAVVVGYPGDGKSVLARRLVHDVAGQGLADLRDGATPTARVRLPVFVRLEEVGRKKSLAAAALDALPAGTPDVVKDEIKKVLTPDPDAKDTPDKVPTGDRAWVVLDGLDEVTETDLPAVQNLIKDLMGRECHVLVTSRPYRYRKGDFNLPTITEFKLAPLDDRQQATFRKEWFERAANPDRRAAVEALARGNPSVAEMGRNALLLSLVCAVSEEKDLDPQNTRRPDVYEAIVDQLYRAVWKETPTEQEDLATQISVLQHVSWQLFRKNPAGWSFHATKEWVPAIEKARRGKLDMTVATFRRGLRASGLVVDTGNGTEAFLHRTFLEYLAAAHVATLDDPAAEFGPFLWQPDAETGRLRWEPAAEEFLTFVAGCLDDPAPVLERIRAEADRHPDALRVMDRLASRCLVDVDHKRLARPLVEDLLDRAERAYRELGRTPTLARALAHPAGVRRLERRLADSGLAGLKDSRGLITQLGPLAATPVVVDAFLALLPHGMDWDDSMATVWALEGLGRAAGSRVVDAVLAALRDRAGGGRWAAAVTLVRLEGAAGPGAVDALIAVRRDHDWSVRWAAAWGLGRLGVADPRTEDALRAAVRDEVGEVRQAAAEALGKLGASAGPGLLDALLAVVLRDPDRKVRGAAAEALGKLGASAGPGLLDALLAALRDADREVRWAAADALDALDALGASAGPGVLDALTAALRGRDRYIRSAAADLLGRLGAADPLLTALLDGDYDVRQTAALALTWLGAASPGVVDALLTALQDKDTWCRSAAATALGLLGAGPGVLDALLAALGDEDRQVRGAAAEALGKLGASAGPGLLDALLAVVLRDPDRQVRGAAAEALGKLGASAGPGLLDALLAALGGGDEWVRRAAAEGLGRLKATTHPGAVPALLAAIQDEDVFVRQAAAKALEELGAAAGAGAAAALITALRDEYGRVARAAAEALEQLLTLRFHVPPSPS